MKKGSVFDYFAIEAFFFSVEYDLFPHGNFPVMDSLPCTLLAVGTLQGFVLGKLDLLTVSLGKQKFASVTDFSLSKLPRESFIVWGLKTAREQKNLLWISLDNYPKAEKGKNQFPE